MVSDFGIVLKLAILLCVCLGASASPTGEVLYVTEGQGFEISCMVITMSGPGEEVTFLKDGHPVGSSFWSRNLGQKLIIEKAHMSDAGVYSCKAGDEVEEVGRVIVQPPDPRIVGITVGVVFGAVALAILIVGAIVYKQRCTS